MLQFQCVWCRRSIEVDHTGWPYVHSLALLHFHMCSARPDDVTASMIEAAATRIADTIEEESRESEGEK